MSIQRVRDSIENLPSFISEFEKVITMGVAAEFRSIQLESQLPILDWNYLLCCASLFARSEKISQQQIALRIADTCIRQPEATNAQRESAAVIFDMMANKRATGLAIKREILAPNWIHSLPLPFRSDFNKRQFEDAIDVGGNKLPVNRFQQKFWETLKKFQFISASAPTSAGKSFILREWIAESFRSKTARVVAIIVPTRALIQEFSEEIDSDISAKKMEGTIHILPLDDSLNATGNHICIFTQERLHILLSRSHDVSFDAVIIDESHKIGDGYRGVLLEQVIEEVKVRNSNVQLIYACPFAENPEYLLQDEPAALSASVDVAVSTVTQNLLFVEPVPYKPTTWLVSHESEHRSIEVGKINFLKRATTKSTRFTTCVLTLTNDEPGNLIYSNEPSQAETYAQQLAAGILSQNGAPRIIDYRLKELIRLVKKTIHPKYLLAKCLAQGVGYHYGNMPLLIRTEIEKLFRENVIKYLVCTGTLIEGVNLPCRAIFIQSPKKGRKQDMETLDFWNLAGRAGRWGHEFQGSIVCVNPKKWPKPPPKSKPKNRITSEVRTTLSRTREFVSYIESGYPSSQAAKSPQFDYVASYLFHLLERDGSVFMMSDYPSPEAARLEEILKIELNEFQMPRSIIFKHPGIPPHYMNQLLTHFEERTDEELLTLIPLLPEADEAPERYQAIFRLINSKLGADWASVDDPFESRLKQLGKLAVEWMRGRPLAVLISTRIGVEEWKEQRGYGRKKRLPSVIIAVMRDVEEYARFKIPKYLKLYIDIFKFVIAGRKLDDQLKDLATLSDLELWLEFGVSTRTQLQLMELGLSRTTAIELMETGIGTELTKAEVLEWLLNEVDIESLNFPLPVAEEIDRVVARYRPKSS